MHTNELTNKKVKLTYFDLSGGRGEACRLALYIAGVDFDDHRVNFNDWASIKSTMPFDQIPMLEIEGEGMLAQSNSILEYIGRQTDLLPEDSFGAARHGAILNHVSDLDTRISITVRMKDDAQRSQARQELREDYMPAWANNLEQQIQGPLFSDHGLSVADLKVFVLVTWIRKAVLDGIPADYFDKYEKITQLHNTVANHPKVVQWYKEHG